MCRNIIVVLLVILFEAIPYRMPPPPQTFQTLGLSNSALTEIIKHDHKLHDTDYKLVLTDICGICSCNTR
jgi:hypothetical protein